MSNKSEDQQEYRYDAFISYRHVEPDRQWAQWLHTKLETYKLPSKLAAELGLPVKLGRVFRDEEELPVSSSLSSQINESLEQSKFLIVVCSRNTPESRWVNQEIIRFRELGRHDRILALLIDGEPAEAFPSALCEIRTSLLSSKTGELTEYVEEVEPLAADVRASRKESPKDLKHFALLRLLAVIHGCRFDDLRQRHQERASKRLMQIATSALVLMGVMAGLAIFAFVQQQEASAQKKIAQQNEFDSRQRLASLHVAEGWRQLDAGLPQLAIPYFLQGFVDDPRAGEEKIDHRVRLASLIESVPSPKKILLGDGNKVVLSAFPNAVHALVKQDDLFHVVDLESNQSIDEFAIPAGFKFMNISEDGKYLLGLNLDGDAPAAQVLNLTSKLSLEFESRLDITKEQAISLLRGGKAQYIEKFSAVLVTKGFMSLRELHIAQNVGNPAVSRSRSFPKLMEFSISEKSPLIALASREFDDEIRFWDLRSASFSPFKIALKKYSTVDVLQYSTSSRELAVVQSSDLTVYQTSNGKVKNRAYSRIFAVNKAMFTSDDSRLVLLGADGAEVLQKNGIGQSDLTSIGFARFPVFDEFESGLAINDAVLVVASLSKIKLLKINDGLRALSEVYLSTIPDAFSMSPQAGDALRIKLGNKIESWNILNVGNLSSRINPQRSYPVGLHVDTDGDVSYLDQQANRMIISDQGKPVAYDLGIGGLENLFTRQSSLWNAVSSREHQLKLVKKSDPGEAGLLHDFGEAIVDVKFSPVDEFLIVSTDVDSFGERGTAHGWDLRESAPSWKFEFDKKIQRVEFDASGKHIFMASADSIVVLDAMTGSLLETLDHENVVTLGLGGKNEFLVSASARKIQVWNAKTLELTSSITKPLNKPYASATMIPIPGQNKFVAKFIGVENHLRVFDLTTGEPLSVKMQMADEGKENIERFAVGPQGRIIAAVGASGSVRTWSVSDGNLLTRPFAIRQDSITQLGNFIQARELRFSDNESWLVAVVNDGAFLRGLYPIEGDEQELHSVSEFLSRHEIDQVGELVPISRDVAKDFDQYFER